MLENHKQYQTRKLGKWRFFSSFPFYHGALTALSSSLSSSYWQRSYRKQTRMCHMGSAVLFVSGCGSIHPSAVSGKTPGSEVQLEIF